ncbi:unnamed protein product [Thlaspi arvense]|uniref:F-box domain-containing protein n=1 Tax=Thlaspi arvense TaxID=13288 RepID=A0AAU9SEN2_THLAR|nr:unnamed protein product [Thlaspi arvense]
MMPSLAASNADDPPPPRAFNQPPLPSLFSSLPIDIAWNILVRVPKRYRPILACVSKKFCYLVRSPEIHRIRSLLGKDSLYICFSDQNTRRNTLNWFYLHRYWFTLRRIENYPTENQLAAAANLVFPYDYDPNPSAIAIVGDKIFVIGGFRGDEIQAESFDLKTQTWEQARDPEYKWPWDHSKSAVSLDKKVYALLSHEQIAVQYDTRDGSCGSFELPKGDDWCEAGVCVAENVLYVYYARFGLMWFDSELMLWRVVNGLSDLKKIRCVGMAEYYGKMAVLWEESSGDSGERKEIWCRMIALGRSEVGIHGTAETAQLLGSVLLGYRMECCLSVSD